MIHVDIKQSASFERVAPAHRASSSSSESLREVMSDSRRPPGYVKGWYMAEGDDVDSGPPSVFSRDHLSAIFRQRPSYRSELRKPVGALDLSPCRTQLQPQNGKPNVHSNHLRWLTDRYQTSDDAPLAYAIWGS